MSTHTIVIPKLVVHLRPPPLFAGTPLVAGLRVSAFSDSEEGVVGHTEKVPWLLESKLKELKAEYHFADDWNPAAVKDGCLITGQNPQSSEKTVALLLEALK